MQAGKHTLLVTDARVTFTRRPFAQPLRLSSGTITEITETRAEVNVVVNGQSATGRGAIYLSDLWAWPDPSRPSGDRDMAMRALTTQLANHLPAIVGDAEHPLAAGLRLHTGVSEYSLRSTMPVLARLVCLSPLDAAIHDAVGQATGKSAFAFYEDDCEIASSDWLFGSAGGTVRAIRDLLRRPPVPALEATLVVGKGDDLAALTPWIADRHYRGFKLKVGGIDPSEDASRVSAVYRWAVKCGIGAPRLTVDANCATRDSSFVAAFLDGLQQRDAAAYAWLEAIEQPTGRDIAVHAFDWHDVGRRKPVLLDEGLTSFDSLTLADGQGWNGMAVKTCRGHSFSLVAAAWAHQHSWKLTMMDLTNPGLAAIHSALFAAHLTGVEAIEMNAAQYTPDANADWLPRLAPLLVPLDGAHRLSKNASSVPGLGSAL